MTLLLDKNVASILILQVHKPSRGKPLTTGLWLVQEASRLMDWYIELKWKEYNNIQTTGWNINDVRLLLYRRRMTTGIHIWYPLACLRMKEYVSASWSYELLVYRYALITGSFLYQQGNISWYQWFTSLLKSIYYQAILYWSDICLP